MIQLRNIKFCYFRLYCILGWYIQWVFIQISAILLPVCVCSSLQFYTSVSSCVYDYNEENVHFCHHKDPSCQLLQHHLLKRLYFFHWIAFISLSKKNQFSILVGLFLGPLFCCINLCVCLTTNIILSGLL